MRAIGEIGLDYYWEKDERARARQQVVFARQMELARELGKPVIVHDREAHGDCLAITRRYPGVTGVYHCYAGSVEMARELLGLGYYLSFTGVITFKNARRALEVIREAPIDRLMVETDSPYMAPEPYRGRRNCSLYVHRMRRHRNGQGHGPGGGRTHHDRKRHAFVWNFRMKNGIFA